MADKLAGIINYLIGVGLMTYILFVLKGKSAEQPEMKIYGQPIKTIITLIYIGIAIGAFLITAILLGWIKY
jgi:hypothetical protein